MIYTRREILAYAATVAAGSTIQPLWRDSSVLDSPPMEPAMWKDSYKSEEELISGWVTPHRSFKPHMRWWWPGNAVTRDGIVWQLDRMKEQGIGGIELMTPWQIYQKGNIAYLSTEHRELVKFAIQQAGLRDIEVSLTFGPGWDFGGFWVNPEHRSKVLTHGWEDVLGPKFYDSDLPACRIARDAHPLTLPFDYISGAPDENRVIAVIAAPIVDGSLDGTRLIDLTDRICDNHLKWDVPKGTWKIMAFRIKYTGEECTTTSFFPRHQWVVDILNAEAVRQYCDFLGGAFYQSFGEEFGRTLDSLFCDSFENAVMPNTIHWTNTVLEDFLVYKGYQLRPYLPAIWWDIGPLTPKIRYDVNDTLSWLALNAFFLTFISWSREHGIDARIQPYYRCLEELIQGAGITPRPEMEVSTARFAVIADPRKAVASGAHFYGRRIVSAEAYTFLHRERYRTTLEEMKIATDAFLRDGVTQFYNHGYLYSPESIVAPGRDVPFANRISHWNTWWRYYHLLSHYVARSSFLLRQGEFVGDVLIYSPQASIWTETVLYDNRRRIMPYGDLGQLLVAVGYDFDLINDDVLQNRAIIDAGKIKIRSLAYRCIILPKISALPLATMHIIERFAASGGLVIGIDELPSSSVGFDRYQDNDSEVRASVGRVFGSEEGTVNGYHNVCVIKNYGVPSFIKSERDFDPGPQETAPLANLRPAQAELLTWLKARLQPDFALCSGALSTGLTFHHRRCGRLDIYLITNLQANPVKEDVTFRTKGNRGSWWNAMDGTRTPVYVFENVPSGIRVNVSLAPYESRFIIFSEGCDCNHLLETTLDVVTGISETAITGLVSHNGIATGIFSAGQTPQQLKITIADLPDPLRLQGTWKLNLTSIDGQRFVREMSELRSWTQDAELSHFSGTGHYSFDFEVPGEYISAVYDLTLDLGEVGNVAEVIVNEVPVGIAWMRPYCIKLGDSLHEGKNHLDVFVVNTLINYVAGLKELPPMSEALVPHYGGQNALYREGANQWESHEKGFHPLPFSGLIGPLRIIPFRKVSIPLAHLPQDTPHTG